MNLELHPAIQAEIARTARAPLWLFFPIATAIQMIHELPGIKLLRGPKGTWAFIWDCLKCRRRSGVEFRPGPKHPRAPLKAAKRLGTAAIKHKETCSSDGRP